MLKVFRPLQVGFNSRVLEQDRKFHFIASATLGINLQTGASILETDFLKDSFEAMGTTSLPDMGMPKPNGEVLLSGKCFAPRRSPVQGCPVSLRVGTIDKTLYVFGDRFWKPGLILKDMTDPIPFAEMPLAFDRAFGGEGFVPNPSGKGFAPIKSPDGLHPLPNIEDPKHLIALAGDRPTPVGFGTLDPAWPQRMRFSGTYDANYKTNYFPGYPPDHDWRYFLCAPEDQWAPGFFRGDEDFAMSHLHPNLPQVAGKLPGLYPRCFILRAHNELPPTFQELPLNLDTIWFFPEKLLALLIFRRGVEVEDDEGEKITHAILGYEDRTQKPREAEHYRRALDRRLTSQDAMLNIFNTSDLIPDGHKCAMEIFMEQALGGAPKSEFGKNLDAKVKGIKKMVDEKVEEAIAKTEKGLDGIKVPANVKDQMPDGGKLDLRAMMNRKPDQPDAEVQALNDKLESILPGITAGDVKKIDMKQFSFSKVEKMMAAVSGFTDRKEKDAKNLAKTELGKAQDQLRAKLTSAKARGDLPPESQASMEQSLKTLEAVDLDAPRISPLPRLNAEEIIASLDSVNPQVFSALQHLEAMKQAGVNDERTQKLEREIHETMEREMSRTADALRQAEKDFKGIYLTSAQFLSDGTSPHKSPAATITAKFKAALAEFRPVANGDWACIDLSGCKLDGIDLSGAYLEQVNFKGASLRGAKLCGAILARSNLEDTDFSGADLSEANLGGVRATRTLFRDAKLKAAKLSKGNFAGADFSRAELEGAETLYISIDGALFAQAHMPGLQFIESVIVGAKFPGADLSGCVFLKGQIRDADFAEAHLPRCLFADMVLDNICFDRADMPEVCFAVSDPQKAEMKHLRFQGASLKQSNFQGLDLRGADFADAYLENCNFSGAELADADLRRAFARGAMFRKARLERAKLDDIDLMNGSLAKAFLIETSLLKANLFGVDFLRATLGKTDFRQSNLENTLLQDWRPS